MPTTTTETSTITTIATTAKLMATTDTPITTTSDVLVDSLFYPFGLVEGDSKLPNTNASYRFISLSNQFPFYYNRHKNIYVSLVFIM